MKWLGLTIVYMVLLLLVLKNDLLGRWMNAL